MPQRFTITGFQKHCNNMGYRLYTYTTSLQNRSEDNLKINVSFEQLVISLAPNRVYLKGNSGLIGFQGVKYIESVNNGNGSGDSYDIICNDITYDGDDDSEITYTIIAQT